MSNARTTPAVLSPFCKTLLAAPLRWTLRTRCGLRSRAIGSKWRHPLSVRGLLAATGLLVVALLTGCDDDTPTETLQQSCERYFEKLRAAAKELGTRPEMLIERCKPFQSFPAPDFPKNGVTP